MTLQQFKLIAKRLLILLLCVMALCTMLAVKGITPLVISIQAAEYIALGYLVMGLFGMCFKQIQLAFACFGCSAAICLLLQPPPKPHHVEKVPYTEFNRGVYPPQVQ